MYVIETCSVEDYRWNDEHSDKWEAKITSVNKVEALEDLMRLFNNGEINSRTEWIRLKHAESGRVYNY